MSRSHASLATASARGAMLLVLSLLSATLLAACMTTAESEAARICGLDPMDPMCSYWRERVQEERETEAERQEFEDSVDARTYRMDTEQDRLDRQWEERVVEVASAPIDATADPELAPLAGVWCMQARPTYIWVASIIEITGEKRLTITELEPGRGLDAEVVNAPRPYGFIAELGDDGFYELQPDWGRSPHQPQGMNDRVRSDGPGVLTYVDHYVAFPGRGSPERTQRTLVPCRPGEG